MNKLAEHLQLPDKEVDEAEYLRRLVAPFPAQSLIVRAMDPGGKELALEVARSVLALQQVAPGVHTRVEWDCLTLGATIAVEVALGNAAGAAAGLQKLAARASRGDTEFERQQKIYIDL